jgi:hypothetical protein
MSSKNREIYGIWLRLVVPIESVAYLTSARTSMTQKCQDIDYLNARKCQDIDDPVFFFNDLIRSFYR